MIKCDISNIFVRNKLHNLLPFSPKLTHALAFINYNPRQHLIYPPDKHFTPLGLHFVVYTNSRRFY